MSFFRFLPFISIGMIVGACVTINVYFPAAAAERAADQIIEQVWGIERKEKSEETPTDTDKEKKPEEDKSSSADGWSNRVIVFLMSPSYAQSANLDISSPAIQAIKERMTKRHQALKTHYDSGAIGLTQSGLITLRDHSKVPLKMRNDVNRGVAEENQDRLSLYQEIAITNGHSEWEADIRATFATRWIDRAQIGWWYQNAKGEWQQKQPR
ncbi:MAG: hypothetical protein BWK79_18185 [Beggiatoa sp. IS2]|nr:MAG: hypothetical protein BWK79_18185 [Beggiatoa sp. IS2]